MPLTVTRPEMLVGGEDRAFRQAVHDALAFSTRLQDIRNGFGEAIGLSGPAYSILIAIEHLAAEEEVGIGRVAEHLHLSGAFVTIEVGKLVRGGLVAKAPDADDGRRVRLSVTDSARARLDALAELQRPVNDALFASLTREQFQAFAGIMSSLVDGAEEALALQHLLAGRRRRRA